MSTPGLSARGLTRTFHGGRTAAVTDIDLDLPPGSRTAVVGESGSGKTTLLRLLLALDRPTGGRITLDGRDIGPGSARSMRWFRRRVQYVAQDPATSLDPRRTVLDLVSAPLRYLGIDADHHRRAADALRAVGLDDSYFGARPARLSGGQNQRVAIARAVACRPSILLADEPVSGLDLDMRDQVLDVLDDLASGTGTALLVVTHDLAVAGRIADRIVVMRAGRIVETGSTAEVLRDPRSDYTRILLAAVPRLPAIEGAP